MGPFSASLTTTSIVLRRDMVRWTPVVRRDAALPLGAPRLLSSSRDGAPVLGEMLRAAPGQRLRGQRRIVRAARAHDGSAKHAEVRHLMREAPSVDHVGGAIVAHAGAAIGMRGGAHGAHRALLDRDRARLHEPLRHLVLDEGAELALVVLV